MNSGTTADRVYDALKRHVLSGAVLPGEKLDPVALSDMVSSSVTPVRDALHRLIGERLVETAHGEGYHAPMATEPALRDLYAWNAQLLRLLVLNWRGSTVTPLSDLPVDIERATIALFDLFAVRTGNPEFSHMLDAAHDRLATARTAERQVMSDLERELRALAVAIDCDRHMVVSRYVAAYHRRRLHMVPAIVRAMFHRP